MAAPSPYTAKTNEILGSLTPGREFTVRDVLEKMRDMGWVPADEQQYVSRHISYRLALLARKREIDRVGKMRVYVRV